ncbi:MAG TPA: Rid family hydrolase [Bauldia sp.]|nr:Rid family hydrolase [Bauldia sp.]
MTITRLDSDGRLSKAVVHGDTVYLGGITPDDPDADIVGQTRQVLATVDDLLARAGTDKSRLLLVNVLLRTRSGTSGSIAPTRHAAIRSAMPTSAGRRPAGASSSWRSRPAEPSSARPVSLHLTSKRVGR